MISNPAASVRARLANLVAMREHEPIRVRRSGDTAQQALVRIRVEERLEVAPAFVRKARVPGTVTLDPVVAVNAAVLGPALKLDDGPEGQRWTAGGPWTP